MDQVKEDINLDKISISEAASPEYSKKFFKQYSEGNLFTVNICDAKIWPECVPPILQQNRVTSLPRLHVQRVLGQTNRTLFQRQCQLNRNFINRLGMSAELEGHCGCVNCIEFNDDGR